MRNYHEHLRAPISWWVTGMVCAAIFGTTLWAGFSVLVAVACYLAFGGGCAAVLLIWGSATIEVMDGELRAGRARLPLGATGEVAVLDESQARALRGPRADPSAFLLIRPYLPLAVYIEVTGPGQRAPYWLIGTRRPADLAAAIQGSRPPARASGSPVG
jgi:hypothetical protein